jgi:hypothetical protein
MKAILLRPTKGHYAVMTQKNPYNAAAIKRAINEAAEIARKIKASRSSASSSRLRSPRLGQGRRDNQSLIKEADQIYCHICKFLQQTM